VEKNRSARTCWCLYGRIGGSAWMRFVTVVADGKKLSAGKNASAG
jgi:hypothetical protein